MTTTAAAADRETAAGPELTPGLARSLIEDLVYEHLIDLVDWERARLLAYIVRGYFVASLDDNAPADVERRAEQLANDAVAAAWKRIAEGERVFMESELSWKGNADDCVLCRELAKQTCQPRG